MLRESEVKYPIDFPLPLPNNSEWKITVKTDFGDFAPLLVGTKTYKIQSVQKPNTEEPKKINN